MDKAHDVAARYTALLLIDEGESVPLIAHKLGINQSNVRRRIYVLEKHGLVRRGARSEKRFWALTDQGKTVLEALRRGFGGARFDDLRSWGKKSLLFRWHNLIFKFSIFDKRGSGDALIFARRLSEKGFQRVDRGIFNGYAQDFEGTLIIWTGKSVLCYPKPVQAGSEVEALVRGYAIAERARARWEKLVGVRLTANLEVCRQQLAVIGGLSVRIPQGYHYASDRVVIDCSTGVAEIETVDKKLAIDDMFTLSHFVDALVRGEVSVAEQGEFREMLSSLATLAAAQQKRIEELERKLE